MATPEQLGLKPGDRIFRIDGPFMFVGRVCETDEKSGNVKVYVENSTSSVPPWELFPEGKADIKADTEGVGKIPNLDVRG